jgi:hypothetical protein
MRQDIAQGKGIALLDPHGDLAEKIMGALPDHRKEDLVYFNARDPDQPYGYNPLKRVVKDKRPLAASGLLEVMKKMWDDAWGRGWSISSAMLSLSFWIRSTSPCPISCGSSTTMLSGSGWEPNVVTHR